MFFSVCMFGVGLGNSTPIVQIMEWDGCNRMGEHVQVGGASFDMGFLY